MQAILDGEILEVAEPGVDAAQRLVGRIGFRHAGFGGEAGLGGGFDDQLREAVAAAAVEPVGLRVFVDQALQLLLVLVEAGSASGGGKWPRVTAAMRRLACAASPGLETMKG